MSLRAENLRKIFFQGEARIVVLDGVDFQTQPGHSLAIVGQSGSGKSTLLALLAGLDRPTEGGVFLGEEPIHKLSETELALFRAKHMGIVFQQFHLMNDLTALENVALPLELQGVPVEQARHRALEALGSVRMEDRKTHFPRQLSGGECQRVAIARALVPRPEILLADEPTGNLDADTAASVAELLFRLVEQSGTTLVLVTHSPELAARCDQTLTLSGGQLRGEP